MPTNKRYILNLDTDSDDVTIGKNACVLKENMRSVTSETDGYGRNETILGNQLLPNPYLPVGTNIRIGSCYDQVSGRIFTANYNSAGNHATYCFDPATGSWSSVLLSNQVAGGLNFDRFHLIKMQVIGNNVYLNDNYNPPRRINVQKGIVANNSNNIVYGIVFNENRTTSGVGLTVSYTSFPTGTADAVGYYQVQGGTVWIPLQSLGFGTTQTSFSPVLTTDLLEYRIEFVDTTGAILDTVYSNTGAYIFPLRQWEITRIVRPTQYPLGVQKVNDSGYNQNFIKDFALQFTLRYVYAAYEESVIGQWSQVALRNATTETFNATDVTLPFSEIIPQDVIEVQLIVRYGNRGAGFHVHSWFAATDVAILNHNIALTQLTYRFYNDKTGNPIGTVATYLPYHTAPLLAAAETTAKDRGFEANVLMGYDTPRTSSLAVQLASISGITNFQAQWVSVQIYLSYNGQNYSTVTPILYVPSLAIYYFIPTYTSPIYGGLLTQNGLTINIDDPAIVTGSGPTIAAAILAAPETNRDWLYTNAIPTGNYEYPAGTPLTATAYRPGSGTNSFRAFKSDSPYEVCLEFLDDPTRRCGKTRSVIVYTQPRSYNQTSFDQTMRWALSNAAAQQEIPIWATHYRVLRTKNLKYDFFASAIAKAAWYYTVDAAGNNVYTGTAYVANAKGIAIDISLLVGFGLGYSYQAATDGSSTDLIEIIRNGQPNITLSVTGQDGAFVLASLRDIGTIGDNATVLFNIYTPYRAAENEFAYEVGNAYPISGAGTSGRQYSVLQGYLNGDVYILQRPGVPNTAGATYPVEVMSPNDKYWKDWEQDIGFGNLTDTIGQVRRLNDIVFTDTYIEGTKTNGLSAFQPSNVKNLPAELAGITALELLSKVQEDGQVMVAWGRTQTASCYLGESQITDNEGNATIAISPNVIGSVNILQGGRGCINPESITIQDGKATWFDAIAGKMVQYGANGLFDASDRKTDRFWRLFGRAYTGLTALQIEALGDRPFVFGGYDPTHKEELWSTPRVLAVPPRGMLVDFPGVVYPYDTWNGQSKMMRYKTEVGQNEFWDGYNAWACEGFVDTGSQLYGFKNGKMYKWNLGNTFFGQPIVAKLSIVENGGEPSAVKVWQNIALEASVVPSFTHIRSEYPVVQSSQVPVAAWRPIQGVQYARLFRNRLTPNQPNYDAAQFAGNEMKCRAIRLHFVFTVPCILSFVNTGFALVKGHQV